MDVIYRDLKPENVLMDEDGHICLTDFGMAKIVEEGKLTKSFVGTPEYLAPEVIEGKGHTKPVDWWSLGVLTFEMVLGLPPFYTKDQNQHVIFKLIKEKEVGFGTKVALSDEIKDFILKLLKKKPGERLGTKGVAEVKAHPWFKVIDWELLVQKKVKPPFKPNVSSDYDVDNFDEEFTKEEPVNSYIDPNAKLLNRFQSEFKDFSYMPKTMGLHEEAE